MTETYRNQDRCEFATRFFGTPPFEVSGGLSLVSDNALVAHLHKLRRTNQFGLIKHCAFMYILLRFYSPTWFPLSNPFPPATSPYLQFDLFDVQSSIYPIRLVLWQEGHALARSSWSCATSVRKRSSVCCKANFTASKRKAFT